MGLIWGESSLIDRAITRQDWTHCADCHGCRTPLGHCGSETCQPGDLPLQPADSCSCCCAQCHHSEADTCTEYDEHRACAHHRELNAPEEED